MNGFLQFYVKTKKVCRCFASFSSEQEHFTHVLYMSALNRPSDVKNRTDHVLRRDKCQSFQAQPRHRGSCIVTLLFLRVYHISTCSACRRGERCLCYIVVSAETPQTSTNPSQTLLPVHKLAHLPVSDTKSSNPRPYNL